MRRIIIVALVALLCNSAVAQISLSELLKGKVTTSSVDKSNAMISAVSSELLIIRQQYRLERNGDYFGKNNLPFYGETYTLGVRVPGGMFLLADAVEPWKNDEDYKRVNASNKYKTELFWSYQRGLSDSIYSPIELEIGTEYVAPVNVEKSLYIHNEARSDFGLTVDHTTGSKSGVLVWVLSKTNVNDSAMTVGFSQKEMSIEVNPDSTTQLSLTPADSSKVLGGIYVVAKPKRGGRVQYMLVGVAVKNEKSEWVLQLLATESNVTKSVDNKSKSEKKKSKKRGKEGREDKNDTSEPTPTKK